MQALAYHTLNELVPPSFLPSLLLRPKLSSTHSSILFQLSKNNHPLRATEVHDNPFHYSVNGS